MNLQHFPGQEWEYATPSDLGVPDYEASEFLRIAKDKNASSLCVVKDGKVLVEYGNVSNLSDMRSVRKSFTALLVGNAVNKGKLDLNSTMADFGITDGANGNQPPLSAFEQQATLEHLLQSKSGIYHPATFETSSMTESKPDRESNPIGEVYHYNNWDFNTAQAIYQENVGDYFEDWGRIFGGTLQFQDFDLDKCVASSSPTKSIYPARRFWMSVRDMCRVGVLMLNKGNWKGQALISPDYFERMTTPYSNRGNRAGMAYSWGTGLRPDGSVDVNRLPGYVYATGNRGQKILVFPHANLVIAVQNDPSLIDQTWSNTFSLIQVARRLPVTHQG